MQNSGEDLNPATGLKSKIVDSLITNLIVKPVKFSLIIMVLLQWFGLLNAQSIANDSIQIVSSWEAGQSYNYQVENYQYKKVNDKELMTNSQAVVNFHVESSTDSTSFIKIKVASYSTGTDSSSMAILEAFNRDILNQLEFEVETDEHGRLIAIINWVSISEAIEVKLQNWDFLKSMGKQQGAQARLVLTSMTNTQAKIETLFYKAYGILFTNYGYYFSLNQPKRYQQQLPNPYDEIPLTKTGSISLKLKNSDSENSMMLTDISSIDKVAGKKVMINLLKQLTQDHYILEEELKNVVFSITDTVAQEFNLENGILLSATVKRRLNLRTVRNEEAQISRLKWTLIRPN